MRRPKLVHFTGIESDEYIHIRASMTFSSHGQFEILDEININLKDIVPTKPIQSLGLLSSNEFRLKVIGTSIQDQEMVVRSFDSDSFGNFNFKIPKPDGNHVARLKLFETRSHPGLDLLIGSFIPTTIHDPKKILITDFDKTMVDTRYSSLKELYLSLRNPIHYFPPVENSLKLIRDLIGEDYQPFIVSASPHFYENAIRDWLYQRQIFTGNIFLKDYRNIFSFFEGDLTRKDLKSQGFYKLNSIVNILLMTGIPDDLILIGDGFESDTIIYLTLAAVLVGRYDPWTLWNQVKKEESFKLTNQQHFRFLSKFYQLKNMSEKKTNAKVQIYIRGKENMMQNLRERSFKLDFANQLHSLVTYYQG
jgi:phosphatidate phosphatase APP1